TRSHGGCIHWCDGIQRGVGADSDCVSSVRGTDVLAAWCKGAARAHRDVNRRDESDGALCPSGPRSLCDAAARKPLCSNLVDGEDVVARDNELAARPASPCGMDRMGCGRVLP